MNICYEWRDAPAADFAVIGDPVAHSRSPQMHQAAYNALGLPYRYVALRVSAGKVGETLDYLTGLGYRGVNVTVPHKQEAMDWTMGADRLTDNVGEPRSLDPLTEKIGVVNTLNLIERSAINTDGPGFLDTLTPYEFARGSTALILGAGGSARAVAAVLPSAGFDVWIWNRTHSRAVALGEEFRLGTVETPTANFDLIVNTTSAGLKSESLPIDWRGAKEEGLAYDLVYGETRFLRDANSHGMRTLDGKALLMSQGARSFEWWLGIPAPREAMLEAIQ